MPIFLTDLNGRSLGMGAFLGQSLFMLLFLLTAAFFVQSFCIHHTAWKLLSPALASLLLYEIDWLAKALQKLFSLRNSMNYDTLTRSKAHKHANCGRHALASRNSPSFIYKAF